MRVSLALLTVGVVACAAVKKGEYGPDPGRDVSGSGNDRGETNGRSFDFVSNKPDGSEWTVRLRGSAFWIAYSKGEKSEEVGNFNLTDDELDKIWDLIDAVGLDRRDEGDEDPKEGTVMMRVREPTDRRHDIHTVYVSRGTEDDAVLDLADYLSRLVERRSEERPNF